MKNIAFTGAWLCAALIGSASLGAHAQVPPTPAPSCNTAPGPGCLYFPSATFAFTTYERSTSYTDAAGDLREIRFLLRQPVGATLPMPAVLWSHGGAGGKTSPAASMVEWSETTARAGYFTVSIAHTPRDAASRERLCLALGITAKATCKVFKFLNWDRPHDIAAVLDAIEGLNAGEFLGQFDLERIAVGGHSAGAGGALTVAGAKRIFTGAPQDLSDPRPIAFMAFSPQQPGSEGFFDTQFNSPGHSWSDVRRPVLTATGDGDSTCNPGPEPGSCIGDTPSGRRIGFLRMPADGNKYQLYLHDANTFHTLFELNASKCAALGVNTAFCDEAVRWLQSAALAFLDAHVRQGVPGALQWLRSRRIEVASGRVAEWLRK